jgi:hypothetical protein
MTVPTTMPTPDGPWPEAARTAGQAEAAARPEVEAEPAAGDVAAAGSAVTVTTVSTGTGTGTGSAGPIIRLPTDPEALRLLEAREEAVLGGEPACLLPRLCPRCGAPGETSVNRICTNCGAALTR